MFVAYGPFSSESELIVDLNSGHNIIGIVDTGVRYTHFDLQPNMTPNGFDLVEDGNAPDAWDTQGHGTHVAGIAAAAKNSFGMMGANPVAKILPVKISNDGPTTEWHMAAGVYTAMDYGAKVVNLSYGGWGYGTQTGFDYYLEIANTFPDALLIAAAGNDGFYDDGNPSLMGHYPSSYGVYIDNIISVGSSDNNDLRSSFSNFGPAVDLFAPGDAINSASHLSDNGFVSYPGTSMSAPLVSGIVSALWARVPSLTALEVKDALLASTEFKSTLMSDTNGRVDMFNLFWGSPAAQTDQTSVEDFTFGEHDSIHTSIQNNNFSPIFNYEISLDNINDLSISDLDGQWVGTLTNENRLRSRALRLISDHMENGVGIFSDLSEFRRTGASESLTLLDFNDSDEVDRRAIMSEMLERGWFRGFDRNSIIDLPEPGVAHDLTETTVQLPANFNEAYFNYSYFTGALDDTLNGLNVPNITSDNFISTGSGSDFVYSGKGNDLLFGDNGNDLMKAQQGDDYLYGGNGNDTLNGGGGNDIIISGSGIDIIKMSKGYDEVHDFELGEDYIRLQDVGGQITFEQFGDDLLISESSDAETREMFLLNVSAEAFERIYPIIL